MAVPYDKLARTLKKGQLYWIETGIPVTEAEAEAHLKDIENRAAYSVPQSLLPIFHAVQLQLDAKKEGNHKLAQEIKQRLSEWLADHPDLHARFAEQLKKDGFKWTPEKIKRAVSWPGRSVR